VMRELESEADKNPISLIAREVSHAMIGYRWIWGQGRRRRGEGVERVLSSTFEVERELILVSWFLSFAGRHHEEVGSSQCELIPFHYISP